MLDKKKILKKQKASEGGSKTFLLIVIHIMLGIVDVLLLKGLLSGANPNLPNPVVLAVLVIAALSIVVTIMCAYRITRSKGAYFASELVLATVWLVGMMIVGRDSIYAPIEAIFLAVVAFIAHLIGQMLIVGLVDIYLAKKK